MNNNNESILLPVKRYYILCVRIWNNIFVVKNVWTIPFADLTMIYDLMTLPLNALDALIDINLFQKFVVSFRFLWQAKWPPRKAIAKGTNQINWQKNLKYEAFQWTALFEIFWIHD